MGKQVFDPDSVRRILLYMCSQNENCYTVCLFDKNNKLLIKAGDPVAGDKEHEIQLSEGERIVGICCYNDGTNGYVGDL